MTGRRSPPSLLARSGALSTAAAVGIAWMLAASLPAHADAPAIRPDLRLHKYQSNPTLYAAARKYFPSDEEAPPPKRIFRLTRDQIDVTVKSLLPSYFAQSVKAAMAKDPLQTNYEFAELLSLNAANLSALSGWIGEIAARVRVKPEGVIDCTASKGAPDCLGAQARAFVVKAFRGDVSQARIERITGFFLSSAQSAGVAQATGDLVEVVLNSPDFLFRKELDVDTDGRLVAAQHLQALTYTLADAPPEMLGLASPDADKLVKSSDDVRATIAAIAASKAAREKLTRFFTAWLEIKEPGEYTISPMVFPEFTPVLAAAMRDESTAFLQAQLGKPAPTLKDITQATQSYVTKSLEPIYGARSADQSGAKATNLDPAQRLGIFSQPAVIASHSGPTNTRLVKRGVFWVRKVMCMELEPPPPGIDVSLYEAKSTTERDRIEKATAKKACIGCHRVIDPFGFFLESYDALGRWRTQDNGHPIDTAVSLDFLDEGEAAETKGPVDALRTLTDSAMFKQCFVRQLFRFYMGRQEEPTDDPLLRRLFFEFATNDNQDIVRLMQLLSTSSIMAQRR